MLFLYRRILRGPTCRTKNDALGEQVFEYILLSALVKECLCAWIFGQRQTGRERPSWAPALTGAGRRFPAPSTPADDSSLGFSASLLNSSSRASPQDGPLSCQVVAERGPGASKVRAPGRSLSLWTTWMANVGGGVWGTASVFFFLFPTPFPGNVTTG